MVLTLSFCNPYSGNEKGSVENKVGYFRNNLFIPEPVINDINDYNQHFLKRCDKNNQRYHYKIHASTLASLLIQEKKLMHDTNLTPFDYSKEVKYRLYKNGHIKVDSNEYSVSPQHWQTYVATLDKDNLREALYFLKHCLIEKDMAFANEVVKENMKQHVMEPEAVNDL
ncbi:hypothetical protein QBE53_13025 [Vallitaleaceae bacterium 9-2]